MSEDIFERLKKQASELREFDAKLTQAKELAEQQAKRIAYLEQFEILFSLRDYRDWRG